MRTLFRAKLEEAEIQALIFEVESIMTDQVQATPSPSSVLGGFSSALATPSRKHHTSFLFDRVALHLLSKLSETRHRYSSFLDSLFRSMDLLNKGHLEVNLCCHLAEAMFSFNPHLDVTKTLIASIYEHTDLESQGKVFISARAWREAGLAVREVVDLSQIEALCPS